METQRVRWHWAVLANRGLTIGLAILMTITLLSLVLPFALGLDALAVSPRNRLQPPSLANWLGTDAFGRDLGARILAGAQTSLSLAAQVTTLSVVVGTTIGMLSAYYRLLDGVLMRICDGLLAIPAIMLAVALTASFGPSAHNLVLALSIVFTPNVARIVRARALAVKSDAFVQASIAMGARPLHVMWKHIFPNTLSVLVVQATFIFADTVIIEAALSFLGAGIQAPEPSWGNILHEGRQVITRAPHIVVFASLALVITVIGLNLAGDGLRDLVDPRHRRRGKAKAETSGTVAEAEAR